MDAMDHGSKQKVAELKMILRKMSLQACCALVLPEFQLSWRAVSQCIRNARLPMVPDSVARILSRHASKNMTLEELSDLVANLRLKLTATQSRTWHVIKLSSPIDEPLDIMSNDLTSRLTMNMKNVKVFKTMWPEIQSAKLNGFVYISIQMVSASKEGPILYLAIPSGLDVALVNTTRSGLLKICVRGLGYETFEDLALSGSDIDSLLHIYNNGNTRRAEHLSTLPEYKVLPVITRSGIDYTGRNYNELYAKEMLGPNPPILTKMKIESEKEFFAPKILNKKMKVKVTLHSDSVADTLCSWAKLSVLPPTSDLFHIFHKIKSNNFHYNPDDEL
ncbi:unnamed protein product [Leptosia nina]|uniref:Uncharacterized protein n=1 Tax=Leptosia nina TaxID=320188 RepID=A0AAV1JUH0_9NEOP